jgi:hypothetical protein
MREPDMDSRPADTDEADATEDALRAENGDDERVPEPVPPGDDGYVPA